MTDTRQTRGAGPKEGLGDLVDLIKDYARQETVDPLKGAGRWVGLVCRQCARDVGGIALAALPGLGRRPEAHSPNLSGHRMLTLLALSVVIDCSHFASTRRHR